MASYYPEGECFFRRESLVYENWWSAADQRRFYSHVLLEYHWNDFYVRGSEASSSRHEHPRSELRVGSGQGSTTRFGVWDKFFVGESTERSVSRMQAVTGHDQNLNFNEVRDFNRGGPRRYILRPIEIRSQNIQWLWIDGTLPLRAIYFPLCHQSDEAFPDFCTYLVIDFRARASINVTNLVGQRQTFELTQEAGLGYRPSVTWGFNVPNIMTFLALPREVRNPEQGLFQTAKAGDELFVREVASRNMPWNTSNFHQTGGFVRHMDLARIISATFGVEVGWRPYQHSSFIVNLLRRVVEFGLGFVPIVGPLLSVGFGMAWQAIEDPGSFSADNILDLTEAILEALLDSSNRGRKYVADDIFPDHKGKAITAPTTKEELEEAKAKGDAANARITEMIHKKLGGKEPPQSQWWLERIADCQRPSNEDLEQGAEALKREIVSLRQKLADDGDAGIEKTQLTGKSKEKIVLQLDTGDRDILEANLRFK